MTDSFQTVLWETFVVRVWREPANGVWRGEIVHLADRASTHFASFAQAEEFMRRYVSRTETGPPSAALDVSESTET